MTDDEIELRKWAEDHVNHGLVQARQALAVLDELAKLRNAITSHHAQKADDRCIEDDDKLYTAAGLPLCDRRVGSIEEMHANCWRFLTNRCEGGGWPTYAELEEQLARAKNDIESLQSIIRESTYAS